MMKPAERRGRNDLARGRLVAVDEAEDSITALDVQPLDAAFAESELVTESNVLENELGPVTASWSRFTSKARSGIPEVSGSHTGCEHGAGVAGSRRRSFVSPIRYQNDGAARVPGRRFCEMASAAGMRE